MQTSNDLDSLDLLQSLSFCVFDLETTGGNHSYDKIIEIGLIKIKKLEIVSEKNILINPEIPIPDFIQKLTSIRNDDLKKCAKIEEVIDEILEFMGDDILVAHNSSFDVPFFNSVLFRLKKPILKNKVICTNLMTKYLIPNILNSNLAYMSSIFGIPHAKAHRALEDAKASAMLLLRYLNFFYEKKIRKINQLYYPRNKFELDRCHYKESDPIESIEKSVRSSKAPLIISVKGDKGILLNCILVNNPERDCEKFLKKLSNVPWKNITLKMSGSFLESFLYLNVIFNKLEKTVQDEIIKEIVSDQLNGIITANAKNDLKHCDFIVARHLVPEQLIIYPLFNLQNNTELVFRFPSQDKKLFQYINNQIRRSDSAATSLHKTNIVKPLLPLFETYISKIYLEKPVDYFIFSKSVMKKDPDQLSESLQVFLGQNPNPFDYPKFHV